MYRLLALRHTAASYSDLLQEVAILLKSISSPSGTEQLPGGGAATDENCSSCRAAAEDPSSMVTASNNTLPGIFRCEELL